MKVEIALDLPPDLVIKHAVLTQLLQLLLGQRRAGLTVAGQSFRRLAFTFAKGLGLSLADDAQFLGCRFFALWAKKTTSK
jgi:hypothetical protein